MRQATIGGIGMRSAVSGALVLALLASGCKTQKTASATTSATASSGATLDLPPSAAPAEALKPLSFMAGRWIGVNPNKTVNEEHWTTPRGNHMVGTFHQIRRDSKPAFIEISLVTADKDGVKLSLRHLHGGLEVPEERKELSVFTLKEAGNDRAEFTGTGKAAAVTSVVYRLTGPNELTVDVSFAPDSKEKGYSSKYVRE